ncbi:MAG: hypothetical protein AAGG11_12665 [Pseudomonadota bacterium]
MLFFVRYYLAIAMSIKKKIAAFVLGATASTLVVLTATGVSIPMNASAQAEPMAGLRIPINRQATPPARLQRVDGLFDNLRIPVEQGVTVTNGANLPISATGTADFGATSLGQWLIWLLICAVVCLAGVNSRKRNRS